MARISDDSGHTGSHIQHDTRVIEAHAGQAITLPGHEYITDSQILRDGPDLVLKPAHGETITIHDYFTADPAPLISSADGVSTLTPDLVHSFVAPVGGVQFAEAGTANDASPVGAIQEVSGGATVHHTDGSVVAATIGTPIYEGDIVETKAHGAVNITFVDHTTFAVSDDAKIAIDKYVFDPASQHGQNDFSVLRGMFVYTSGLIGHADPDDVKIHTPVGSIGIRGTTIMGTIDPHGDSHVSIVEGAIVVRNATGEQTLSQQFETVQLHGMNSPITPDGVLSAAEITNHYNVLRTVSGPLFSTFDDMSHNAAPAANDGHAAPAHDVPATHDSPAQTAPAHDAPAHSAVPADHAQVVAPTTDTAQPTPQVASMDVSQTSLDAGFDSSAGVASQTVFAPAAPGAAALPDDSGVLHVTGAVVPPPAPLPVSGGESMVAGAPATGAVVDPAADPGAATVLPPLALSFTPSDLSSTALVAGMVVAHVTTTAHYPGVTYGWEGGQVPTDGTNPLFTLSQNADGSASLLLTAAGASYLHAGSDIAYGMTATLADGRTTNASSDVTVHAPVAALPPYDLLLNNVIDHGTGGQYLASPTANAQYGHVTAALGDYNHDGQMDFAVTTDMASGNMVYIRDDASIHATLNMASTPFGLVDTTALSVSAAGDFNGDGTGDIIVGAPNNLPTYHAGDVFILDGTNPNNVLTTVTGFNDGAFSGTSVSGIGDYNGDGFNDIIIGAPESSGQGHAYVIFGGPSVSNVDISTMNPSQGFAITGPAGDHFGQVVGGIGDYNHDGFSDLAVLSSATQSLSLYFGNSNGSMGTSMSTTLPGTDADSKIFTLGDMNGDGIADFGVSSGMSGSDVYIFDGSTAPSSSPATYLHGAAGTTVLAAGNAGDFNGDGHNDVALALRNGSAVDVYVVYGGSLGTDVDVSALPASQEFHMQLDLNALDMNLGLPATDPIQMTVNAAGDLTGDGFDDLMIGISSIDADGGTHTDDGGVLLIDGRAEAGAPIHMNATAAGETLLGGGGNDTLNSSYADTGFIGGGGNDTMQMYAANGLHAADGGAGTDTLAFMAPTTMLDLRSTNLENIEILFMNGGASPTMKLGLDQIFSLMQESADHTLAISANGNGGTLQIDNNGSAASSLAGAGFTTAADTTVNGITCHGYQHGGYTLYVDASMATPQVQDFS